MALDSPQSLPLQGEGGFCEAKDGWGGFNLQKGYLFNHDSPHPPQAVPLFLAGDGTLLSFGHFPWQGNLHQGEGFLQKTRILGYLPHLIRHSVTPSPSRGRLLELIMCSLPKTPVGHIALKIYRTQSRISQIPTEFISPYRRSWRFPTTR